MIPTHRSNASHRSPVVPKLDLTSPTEVDSGGLRESDRRPPSIVGQKTADVMQAGDVTKDHVMGQLSALREQLNRLQQVKRTQGQPLKVTDSFDTPLERAAKRRQPPPPGMLIISFLTIRKYSGYFKPNKNYLLVLLSLAAFIIFRHKNKHKKQANLKYGQ